MKIGELARVAGCQSLTLRFHEGKGLLGSAIRWESKYAVYREQDLDHLIFIRNCGALGLTLM